MSASLWGCELKSAIDNDLPILNKVSLLVRLWVEMKSSDSSMNTKQVSLLVRLWVEIKEHGIYGEDVESASLWGCELKYCWVWEVILASRQPPCEAVSWNVTTKFALLFWLTSASLWGCELKYIHPRVLPRLHRRQPPCEAVSWNNQRLCYT